MSKVLVTGGAGYIGAHVATELVNTGYEVRIFDDFSNGLPRRIEGRFSDVVSGDICDREALIKATQGIDSVIHLAAKKSVGESVAQPMKYYENNVGGTLNLLAAMSLTKVNKIVFSSSAAVYAPSEKSAIDESDLTEPLSPYGATKLLSEKLISTIGQADQISNISLRYFNVVGAGDDHLGDNARDNLVPRVFNAISNNLQPEIFGTDYPTKDGTCIRDYIHVSDLARAHVSALKKIESGYLSEVYNVGSGTGFSVKEVFDQMEKSMGMELNPKLSPRRPGDSPKLIASIAKIERDLGWKPTQTLKEMIDSAWRAEQASA